MIGYIHSLTCACGVRFVTAAPLWAWTERVTAERVEAVELAALRSGWIHYQAARSWSCPACVDRSDHGAAEYRGAAIRMLERVRKALAL